jgi:septal ring factor EnvC (AmiA/AmiB activator)
VNAQAPEPNSPKESTALPSAQNAAQIDQMATVEAQLAELRESLTEGNPKVQRLEAMLQGLKTSQQIATVEAQLTVLRKTCTEQNPAIRRLEIELRALQQGQAYDKPK